jgi:replicative DNA helicase
MLLGKPVPLLKTGLEPVDNELGGLRGGDMVLVMAATGLGKSSLLGCLALNAARARLPTIVFSLEMTREQWIERTVCDLAFEDCRYAGARTLWYSRIRNGHIEAGEMERFVIGAGKLQGLPLEIQDDGDLTIQQIATRARAFKARHGQAGLGLIVIDYAQIVTPVDDRANREQQVASVARGAKALAKQLGWPVVIGSQVNDNAANRSKDERRPQLGDTRESKALGQEADIALSPYRQAYFVQHRKPMDAVVGDSAWLAWKAELKACENRLDLLVLKNRHGRMVDIELWCDMGASAIRGEEPSFRTAEQEADMLALAGR